MGLKIFPTGKPPTSTIAQQAPGAAAETAEPSRAALGSGPSTAIAALLEPPPTTSRDGDFGHAAVHAMGWADALELPAARCERHARDVLDSTLAVIDGIAGGILGRYTSLGRPATPAEAAEFEHSIAALLAHGEATMVRLAAGILADGLHSAPTAGMARALGFASSRLWAELRDARSALAVPVHWLADGNQRHLMDANALLAHLRQVSR